MNIDMGYGISIWDTGYRYDCLPYRHGHPGYRYGIWAKDMGDDSIDMVISHIDMGYLVTLLPTIASSYDSSPSPFDDPVVAAQLAFESKV